MKLLFALLLITYLPSDSSEIVSLLRQADTSVLTLARHFIGRPYVAHTLEVNDEEQLVVNTRQLDCTTLVETVTALKLCTQRGDTTFQAYTDMLTRLRYRDGQLDGYPSRLHYFSDWILDKEHMGMVSEISSNGAPFTAIQRLNIFYMSRHPQSYKALKTHPQFVPTIAKQEKALTGRTFHYIPKQQIDNSQLLRRNIKDGDIIAITCSKAGLDIAHLGFAVWQKDGLHLLNASQLHKRVILEPMTLRQYLSKHPSHTGIRVVRINQP